MAATATVSSPRPVTTMKGGMATPRAFTVSTNSSALVPGSE